MTELETKLVKQLVNTLYRNNIFPDHILHNSTISVWRTGKSAPTKSKLLEALIYTAEELQKRNYYYMNNSRTRGAKNPMDSAFSTKTSGKLKNKRKDFLTAYSYVLESNF